MTIRRISLWLTAIVLILCNSSWAQLSTGGRPLSFDRTARGKTIPSIKTEALDRPTLLAEDEIDKKFGTPLRFGFPHDVSYNLENSGVWETLPNGDRLWNLRLECPEAYSINLVYDDFHLPEGAKFYLYSEDRSMVIGAFTARNNKADRVFSTSPVKGDVCILEYYEPAEVDFPGTISISRIVHAYHNLFSRNFAEKAGFGSSGSCNNNVNCPEGAGWQDEKRGIAMVILSGGTRWCSGSLINNTREDLTQYFLTANHCLGSSNTWIFMFNYESPTCTDINGPTWMTVQGSVLRAANSNSDVGLVEITEQIPDSFNVFYNGWSRSNTPASNTIGIHHPAGDIKKISFDYDPPIHSGNYWRVVDWNDGTTEGGSSGSPLFNNSHLIVGQLYGGFAACENDEWDEYGKFGVSWDAGSSSSGRLKDWLDPDNLDSSTLSGLDATLLNFSATPSAGFEPLNVLFGGTSRQTVVDWSWDFGNDDSAFVQSPNYVYTAPGSYTVSLQGITDTDDTLSFVKSDYILVLADSLIGDSLAINNNDDIMIEVRARNYAPVDYFKIPLEYSGDISLTYDSMSTVGTRTDYFQDVTFIHYDIVGKRRTLRLRTSPTAGAVPELPPGEGVIVRLYFSIDGIPTAGQSTPILFDGYVNGPTTYDTWFYGSILDYQPRLASGEVLFASCCLLRGDADHSGAVDITDLTYMVDYFFAAGPVFICPDEGNIDGLGGVDITDLTYLVDYMFNAGPAPPACF
ncbi:MAG: PKD domain-containing protein [bacterium]|nr:PKD domain-containing protein [bacterium]